MDFEFYREQEPDGGDAAVYEELSRRIDVDELARILAADGPDGVTERLRDEVNNEEFEDHAENDG